MLELKGIVKNYETAGEMVEALKGVDLAFRRNEFVSILGQSGCGKTTLLNIIGGLDQYTEGDLVIDGISTKQYKDRDWDSYRNHKIGFVFQSYNLIPHQTVLSNVEIALSLSGVPKSERRKRAKEALEKVGLGDQLNKRPNQMSGGQMQRVAIARALVNNPDIILADEPTGALDTETSVQVMDILREISKERLIIMVTHNPELAQEYSSRIIRMLDGKITDDSNPLSEEEIKALHAEDKRALEAVKETAKEKKQKKPSMSFATSFMLSLRNLFTKKGRTTLTAFAGSIGIIGISLILAVSKGTTAYIDAVQEEALASYPITLEATTVELTSIMEAFMNVTDESVDHDKDAIYQKGSLANMVNAMNSITETENDLKSFNEYLKAELDDPESELSKAVKGVQYSYDLDLLIYTENVDGKILRSDAETLLMELMVKYFGDSFGQMMTMSESSPMSSMTMSVKLWQEMLPGRDGKILNDLIYDQYEIVEGNWPAAYNEVVLVADKNNEVDDLALYALGLISEKDIDVIFDATINKTTVEDNKQTWNYSDILDLEYKTILSSDCFSYNADTGLWDDLREDEDTLKELYDTKAIPMKVVGIIRPQEDCDSPMLTGSIAYTSLLTEYLIRESEKSLNVAEQMENADTDILTGKPFSEYKQNAPASDKKTELVKYVSTLTVEEKAELYRTIVATDIADSIFGEMDRSEMEEFAVENSSQSADGEMANAELIKSYFKSLTDEQLKDLLFTQTVDGIKLMISTPMQGMTGEVSDGSASSQSPIMLTEENQMRVGMLMQMSSDEIAVLLDSEIDGYEDERAAMYHKIVYSSGTYKENLRTMGYVDLETPAAINIYANSFENKDVITDAIESYNAQFDNDHSDKRIKYTDYIGIILSSVTTIIDAITYVLIAFVSISLIVSSIMIGVITLISVQERTKEIGILRAIGASKKNVSRMFNAETMIVGFSAGLLGVLVTYLLCIPINIILYALTDIPNLKAVLPVPAAIILVAISVLLTLISGIIPSRSAAKKDPVVALRTE